MKQTAKERFENYIQGASARLLPKVPLVIVVNGRGFNNATSLIDKPYSDKLAKALCAAMMALIQEVGGTVFGYQFDDEIVIVARNDQTLETQPWCNNDTQKIASIASSVATLSFNSFVSVNEVENFGSATFHANAFAVPSITEAINFLIYKQQQAFQSSVYYACFYELLKRNHDKGDIEGMLDNTSMEDKVALLQQECGIDYDKAYPLVFRRGAACYRQEKAVLFQGVSSTKMRWELDANLPIFTKDTSFLGGILGR